jgi:hypothetical protein
MELEHVERRRWVEQISALNERVNTETREAMSAGT